MKPHLKIDIVSDVVCPWCYIGKRRLEKAIKEIEENYTFTINYLPFQLSPDTPAEGENTKERLIAKFGGEARYHQIIKQVSLVAAGEGLNFDLENQTISPNTHLLHRLAWYAQQQGKQLEMMEALFQAYFEQRMDLSKIENILTLAINVGLDAERVRALLVSDEGKEAIDQLLYQNHLMGVSGVPYYIINDKYAISGAQPTKLFLKPSPKLPKKHLYKHPPKEPFAILKQACAD
ncbi:MAG: DsbA family oxidoreductase [Spirosomataceae bacterium]